VSNLYLIRHGQAGPRDAYDSLSELGRRQSQLLGHYFRSQGIQFTASFCGEMCRQQQTAREAKSGYGEGFPDIVVDSGWSEFDLDRLYREIAPSLCTRNADFKQEYEAMRHQLSATRGEHDAGVHRRWLPCDTAIVNAWIRDEYPYTGESWQQFQQRVAACHSRMNSSRHDNVAVFTSATPIAIWAGLALEIADERLLKIAGVLHNASLTIIQVRDDRFRLFMLNATPHLVSKDLRTFR
jgi:broad specificity phosphatase PhoE